MFAASSGEKRAQDEDLATTPQKRPSMGMASPSKAAAAGIDVTAAAGPRVTAAAGPNVTAAAGPDVTAAAGQGVVAGSSDKKRARGGLTKFMPLRSPNKTEPGQKVSALAKAKELTARARAAAGEAARPVNTGTVPPDVFILGIYTDYGDS